MSTIGFCDEGYYCFKLTLFFWDESTNCSRHRGLLIPMLLEALGSGAVDATISQVPVGAGDQGRRRATLNRGNSVNTPVYPRNNSFITSLVR
jgi:hypothetical protein